MKHLCTITALLLLGATAFAADYKPHKATYHTGQTEDLRPYIISGVPITAAMGDSSYALLALETGRIGSKQYVKLWLLYQNLGGEPFLFEPLSHIKMTIETDKEPLAGLSPVPPSQLAKDIDTDEQAGAITARYIEPLRSVAAETAPPPADPAAVPGDSANPPDQAAVEAAAARARMRSPSYMYRTFISSANNGLLRRDTVFPGKSVNGYVYVLAPGADLEKCAKVTVYLTFNDGIRAFEFKPLAGE